MPDIDPLCANPIHVKTIVILMGGSIHRIVSIHHFVGWQKCCYRTKQLLMCSIQLVETQLTSVHGDHPIGVRHQRLPLGVTRHNTVANKCGR